MMGFLHTLGYCLHLNDTASWCTMGRHSYIGIGYSPWSRSHPPPPPDTLALLLSCEGHAGVGVVHRTWWYTQPFHSHSGSGCSPSSKTGFLHTLGVHPSHLHDTNVWYTPLRHFYSYTNCNPPSSGQCLVHLGTQAPLALLLPAGKWMPAAVADRASWCRR